MLPDPRPPRLEPSALAEFVGQRRADLLAFITTRLGPELRGKMTAEDVLQQVFLTAQTSPPPAELPAGALFSWLCEVARHRIIDAARSPALRPAPQAPDTDAGPWEDRLADSGTSPSSVFARDERRDRVRAAVARLTPEQSDALRWRFTDGLGTKEIAERLGKSDGAVRVLLTRTLHQLRAALGDDFLA